MTFVSIVVISKNERALAGTLDALAGMTDEVEHEVIVVDASRKRLDDIRAARPWVRWIDFEPVPGKRVTIPEQRNRGVAEARGDIIVYTDAGCYPRDGWLSRLVGPIVAGRESATCGMTGSASGRHIYDTWGVEGEYLEECATINLAFTREAFQKVGGFDETFDYCSDTDFTWRLNDAGVRIRLVPEARVDHDWGGTARQVKRAWYYGAGRAKLYATHRTAARWKSMPQRDPILVAYPLFLLGLPLTLKFKAYPLLVAVPLLRNRSSQPARTLMDHLCYGAGALGFVAGHAR
ncbi:MAG: hypothetical protein QOJ11_888 [Frankiales bacterium]|jgi:GT2 family glycosyltransferase|nr:hypothetical protein [Frankiales bacterium]